MAADFARVTDGELVAVGSRDEARATAFAAAHGIPKAHGSYAALVTDPDVDAVYIATPRARQHVDIALAALAAGKAILVEGIHSLGGRPERGHETARAGVFAMEAMWTRFVPGITEARELITSGAIGQLENGPGRPHGVPWLRPDRPPIY